MRRCQRLGCENSLDGFRADAQYCSPTCKRQAARSRDLSDGSASPGFWDRYARIRRPSRGRNAHGVAVTMLAGLLLLLAGCGGSTPVATPAGNVSPQQASRLLTRPATANKPVTTHDVIVPVNTACPLGHATMGCSVQPSPLAAALDSTGAGTPSGPKFPDVSNAQGHPDWAAAKRWGIWGAVAKLGEGITFHDPDAGYNISQFRALHIRWSVYWYIRPESAGGCIAEGNQIVSSLKAIPGGPSTTGPVVIQDAEIPGIQGYTPCIDRIVYQAFHRHTVTYTAPGTWAGGPGAGDGAWMAAYGPTSSPACPWGCKVLAWQYTDGQYGFPTYIPGIGSGDVSVSYSLFNVHPSKPPAHHPQTVCFGAHREHSAACDQVRQHAAVLGRQRDQQRAFLKISVHNLTVLEARIAAVQGRIKAEQTKATSLNSELLKLLGQYGYHTAGGHS